MKNKKKTLIILGILLTLSIIVGVSYAWWTYNTSQTGINHIKSDCFSVQIIDDENESILLENAFPLTDEEGYATNPYKFIVKNNCELSISYDLNLEIMGTINRLQSNFIAVSLNGEEKQILNTLKETTPTYKDNEYEALEGRLLDSGELGAKESKSYSLRLWMNQDVKITDDVMNKTFISKISIDASLITAYNEDILNGADPVIDRDLIPITIEYIEDEGVIVKYADIKKEWYNYENKEWANAVILTATGKTKNYEVGNIILETDIESYFVWIPKYRYKIWDLGEYSGLTSVDNSKVHPIEIEFGLTDTVDNDTNEKYIECTTPMNEDRTQGLSGESGNCDVGDWMTHPAFISFGVNGLWVGKFETGYMGATSTIGARQNPDTSKDYGVTAARNIIIKPNIYSWSDIEIKNAYYVSYQYQRELDSHMMKNTEWGAVAYLTNSIYGRCDKNSKICDEVTINSNSSIITGYANSNIPYSNPSSVSASTTGNYNGIYDMNGGVEEYTISVILQNNGTPNNSYIHFDDSNFPTDLKYFDIYSYIPSGNDTSYNYRILGDATGEMGPFSGGKISSWYGDGVWFISTTFPYSTRGGRYDRGTKSGIFTFVAGSSVHRSISGFRVVLAI